MSTRATLPNSSNPQAPAPVSVLPKIIALSLTVAAGVLTYVARDQQQIVSGVALIGTVGALGFLFVRSQQGPDESAENAGAVTGDLARTIETNRAEYIARLAELKKSIDAQKTDNSATRENEAIRQEIGRLRTELASLRSAVAAR